jgi:flavin-dependent dehydrogenase
VQDLAGVRRHYDVVIAGARCAGAATALLLARAGAKVLVVDRQKYGTDTVSTHALMRAGVMQLDRWGVLPAVMAAGTPPVRESTFYYGGEAVHIDIKPEHGVDFLCAPRRTVLDRVLVDAASAAGAEMRHEVAVGGLRFAADGRVTGVELRDRANDGVAVDAAVVIGADGRQSTVAKLAGARTYVEGRAGSGYVYGYYAGMVDDGFHWHFADGCAAGRIPTNDAQHCVFVGVPGGRFAEYFRGGLEGGFLKAAAANSPALRETIERARLQGRLRGFVSIPGYMRQPHGPGWALVGDAGYFKDPLTAHGITDALRDADLLARAVLDGSAPAYARYQEERDSLSRPLFEVTDAIAGLDRSLDEVKELHGRLSDAMKAEARHVAGLLALNALAA